MSGRGSSEGFSKKKYSLSPILKPPTPILKMNQPDSQNPNRLILLKLAVCTKIFENRCGVRGFRIGPIHLRIGVGGLRIGEREYFFSENPSMMKYNNFLVNLRTSSSVM